MGRIDPLGRYNAKRDFAKTPEPAGEAKGSAGGNLFVVQKHEATRLHWDFRLEADGVLWSWAVTKGPSADPGDRRLAVRTEDHPLDYAGFEGSIPEGEYGGGTVMLWDRGTWEPVEGKSADDVKRGHLHFRLHGERMKGEWLLVRMRGRPGEKRENWLLRKVGDAFAEAGDVLVERGLTSVLTGRSMAEIAADRKGSRALSGKSKAAFAETMEAAARHNRAVSRRKGKPAKAGAPPPFEPVQLATLVDAVPAGNGWMHEIKFDGYRVLAAVAGERVTLHTRTGLDWTERFPAIAKALGALDLPPALIDGEVVALDADGNPDFAALQDALSSGRGEAMRLFAFDLLALDGEDLKPRGNLERKERLAALLARASAPIHVADHVIGAGEKLFATVCGAGGEGIVCKRADAAYAGKRTQAWLKVKCIERQEFIVIGWSASDKGRAFRSLLLAQHDEAGRLAYRGKVGTGFGGDRMADLAERFAALRTDRPAAEVPRSEARGARWVRPELVAEIAFAEFTTDLRVRHASFIALREDKPARAVGTERPAKAPAADDAAVRISNRDRVIFPDTGQTKGDLADYCAKLAPVMLPHMSGRPLSLVRCPQGRAKQCFFQKHDSGTFGEHVRHVPIAEKDGAVEDYLYVDDAAGVLACVQMGAIEFHGWGSHAAAVEQPDRMVFDLDPDEGLDFARVKQAAFDIRARLADMGLVSFAMLSGGKGMHVIVPVDAGHDWDVHKDFARRFSLALAGLEPDRFTATMSKAERKGRIFIDWLRNQRGATAVMPYSARARPGAPVAVPVDWDELEGIDKAGRFTIADGDELLERAGSRALAGWGIASQSLPDA